MTALEPWLSRVGRPAVALVTGPALLAVALLVSPGPALPAMHSSAFFGLLLIVLVPFPLCAWAASAGPATGTDGATPMASPRRRASSRPSRAPSSLPPVPGWGDDPRLHFVASMGHDLRSPLNAMLGFADLLQMTAEAQDAGQADSLEVIRQRTRDLLAVIDDMLLWAKLESGGLGLERQSVSVRELFDRAAALAEVRSGARGLSVRCEIQTDLPPLQVDADRVVQSLVALMHDAIQASEPAEVCLRARRVGGDLRIDVRDPSMLVRPADHDGFFEAFRPSFAPSGQRVAGLGVGMACARAFIRAHGGELSLHTAPNSGTTFTLQLPLASC